MENSRRWGAISNPRTNHVGDSCTEAESHAGANPADPARSLVIIARSARDREKVCTANPDLAILSQP